MCQLKNNTVMLTLQTPGINDVWHYNELLLDSSARDGGSNEAPVFHLSRPLSDVLAVHLLQLDLPLSFFTFRRFQVTLDVNAAAAQLPDYYESMTFHISPGFYRSPLELAQQIAQSADVLLRRLFDARYVLAARLDTTGHVVFEMRDRLSDAYAPPDPDGIYRFRLGFGRSDGEDEPVDIAFALGFQNNLHRGTDWSLDNRATALDLPDHFPVPQTLHLTSNLSHLTSGHIQFDGSTAQTPSYLLRTDLRSSFPTRRLRHAAYQHALYPATDGLPTLQTLRFALSFDDTLFRLLPNRTNDPTSRIDLPDKQFMDVDLRGQPWTLRLGILTQRTTKVSRRLMGKIATE